MTEVDELQTTLRLLRATERRLRLVGWSQHWGRAGTPACLMGTWALVNGHSPNLVARSRPYSEVLRRGAEVFGFHEVGSAVKWNDSQRHVRSVLARVAKAIERCERRLAAIEIETSMKEPVATGGIHDDQPLPA